MVWPFAFHNKIGIESCGGKKKSCEKTVFPLLVLTHCFVSTLFMVSGVVILLEQWYQSKGWALPGGTQS